MKNTKKKSWKGSVGMNDEDIKILEGLKESLSKNIERLYDDDISTKMHYIYSLRDRQCKAIENLLNRNKELKEENENLISDNLEYQRTQDIFDKRTYRKKYLEERRKEEPNLLYPDADEIYERYYNQKTEIENLKEIEQEHRKENGELRENLKIATAMLTKGTYPSENEEDNDFEKQFVPVAKIKEICDNYINPLREYLDEDRTWCDMELIENFEALKEDLLEVK